MAGSSLGVNSCPIDPILVDNGHKVATWCAGKPGRRRCRRLMRNFHASQSAVGTADHHSSPAALLADRLPREAGRHASAATWARSVEQLLDHARRYPHRSSRTPTAKPRCRPSSPTPAPHRCSVTTHLPPNMPPGSSNTASPHAQNPTRQHPPPSHTQPCTAASRPLPGHFAPSVPD